MLGDGTLQPLLGVKKPSPAAKTRLQPATRGFLIPREVTHCLMPGGLDLRRRPLVFASLWDETILPASLQIVLLEVILVKTTLRNPVFVPMVTKRFRRAASFQPVSGADGTSMALD